MGSMEEKTNIWCLSVLVLQTCAIAKHYRQNIGDFEDKRKVIVQPGSQRRVNHKRFFSLPEQTDYLNETRYSKLTL